MARTPRRRRRIEEDDSDSDLDENHDEEVSVVDTLTAEEKVQNAKIVQMQDLGSAVRDFITSVEVGPRQSVNVKKLLQERECNQEGTDAAEKALKNRSQLNAWANYGSTIPKDGTFEELTSIADGNAHRVATKKKLLDEGLFTLEDTYDERSRRRGPPTARVARGGSAAVSNVRGRALGGRGGGFAGRGTGRNTPVNDGIRPLDPAVDPNRQYVYKTGPKYQSESAPKNGPQKASESKNKGVASGKSNTPLTMGPYKVTKPAASAFSKGKAKAPKPVAASPRAKVEPPQLADPNNFMAFVNQKLAAARQSAGQVASVPQQNNTNIVSPSQHSNGAENSAQRQLPSASDSSSAQKDEQSVRKIPIRELRFAPSGQPNALTDGLPSPGKASCFSSSAQSETQSTQKGPVGLGVSGLTLEQTFAKEELDQVPVEAASPSVDLLGTDVPEVESEVLTPSPKLGDDMVSIPKRDAEKYDALNKLLTAGNMDAILDFIKRQTSEEKVPVPQQLGVPDTTAGDSGQTRAGFGARNLPSGTGKHVVALQESKWAQKPKSDAGCEPVQDHKPQEAQSPRRLPAATSEKNKNTLKAGGFGVSAKPLRNPFSPREPPKARDDITPGHFSATRRLSPLSIPRQAALIPPTGRLSPVATTSQQNTKQMTFDEALVLAMNSSLTIGPPRKHTKTLSSAGSDHSTILVGSLGASKFAASNTCQKENGKPLASKPVAAVKIIDDTTIMPPPPNPSILSPILGDGRNLKRQTPGIKGPAPFSPTAAYLPPRKPKGIVRYKAGPGYDLLMKEIQEAKTAAAKQNEVTTTTATPRQNPFDFSMPKGPPRPTHGAIYQTYREQVAIESDESEL